MVVVYASGMLTPGMQLPQTATVTLQDRWARRKGETTPVGTGTFDYSQFEAIYSLLKGEYYDQDKILTGKLLEGALKGMVSALDDPYTTFFDTQENTEFTEELKGEQDFEGIGAAVLKKDEAKAIEIQEVYKGTPSFEAGLRQFDLVVKINDEETAAMSTDDAVKKIRGPKGTSVTLTVIRPSETDAKKRLFTLTIVRQKISIPSVSSEIQTVAGKKLGYINISIIGQETEKAMKQTVTDLVAQGVQGVILDMRGNGGGFLDIGVEVASHFISGGATVVTTKYLNESYNETYKSQGYAEFAKVPVVVLADQYTASAGEIIAAALREINGSLIVGAKTYGKGSIQTIQQFGSGSAIKFTIGRRYTPKGENIDKVGLTPDVEVVFDSEKYQKDRSDNQLQRAQVELVKLIK